MYITSNIHHVFIALEIWPFYLIELWRGLGSILKLPLSMIVYCSMPNLRNFHSNGDIIFTSAFIRGANGLLIWRKNFHATPARHLTSVLQSHNLTMHWQLCLQVPWLSNTIIMHFFLHHTQVTVMTHKFVCPRILSMIYRYLKYGYVWTIFQIDPSFAGKTYLVRNPKFKQLCSTPNVSLIVAKQRKEDPTKLRTESKNEVILISVLCISYSIIPFT